MSFLYLERFAIQGLTKGGSIWFTVVPKAPGITNGVLDGTTRFGRIKGKQISIPFGWGNARIEVLRSGAVSESSWYQQSPILDLHT